MSLRLRVAAIVVHEERVLLVSTNRGRPGYLVPPGGGVEHDESLADAVTREVAEETGLTARPGNLLAYRELHTPRGLTVELYFSAQLGLAPSVVSTEGRAIRWVPLGELAELPHYPEQLVELCARAAEPTAGAIFLGGADMSHESEKEPPHRE